MRRDPIRRREQVKQARLRLLERDPDYFRRRRREKTEVLIQERERHKRWKLENPEKLRVQQQAYRARKRQPDTPIPELHTGHELFDRAKDFVMVSSSEGRYFKFENEVDAEDARSEAVLALLEGRDPEIAVSSYMRKQRSMCYHNVPFEEYKYGDKECTD